MANEQIQSQLQTGDPSTANQIGGALASGLLGGILGYASVATGQDFLSVLPQRQADIRKERRLRQAAFNKLSLALNEGGEEAERTVLKALGDPEDPVAAIGQLDAASAEEIHSMLISDRARRTNTAEDARKLYAELKPAAMGRGINPEQFDPESPESVRELKGVIDEHDRQQGLGRQKLTDSAQRVQDELEPLLDPSTPEEVWVNAFASVVPLVKGEPVVQSMLRGYQRRWDSIQAADYSKRVADAGAANDWGMLQTEYQQASDTQRQQILSAAAGQIRPGTVYYNNYNRLVGLIEDEAALPENLAAAASLVQESDDLAGLVEARGPGVLGELAAVSADIDKAQVEHKVRTEAGPQIEEDIRQQFVTAGDNGFLFGTLTGNIYTTTLDGNVQPTVQAQQALNSAWQENISSATTAADLKSAETALQNGSIILSQDNKVQLQQLINERRGQILEQPYTPELIPAGDVEKINDQIANTLNNPELPADTGIFPVQAITSMQEGIWGAQVEDFDQQLISLTTSLRQQEARNDFKDIRAVTELENRIQKTQQRQVAAQVARRGRTVYRTVVDTAFLDIEENNFADIFANQLGKSLEDWQGEPGIAGGQNFIKQATAAAEDGDVEAFSRAFMGTVAANGSTLANQITAGAGSSEIVNTALQGLATGFDARVDDMELWVSNYLNAEIEEKKRSVVGTIANEWAAYFGIGVTDQKQRNIGALKAIGIPVPKNKKYEFSLGTSTAEFKIEHMDARDIAALAVLYHGA